MDFNPDEAMAALENQQPAQQSNSTQISGEIPAEPQAASSVPEGFNPDEAMAAIKPEKPFNVGETAEAGFEGVANAATAGFGKPLAKWLRSKADLLGVDPDTMAPDLESMEKREQEHPIAHGVGAFAGTALALSSIGKLLPQATSVGTAALKGALEMGALSSGDEISKALTNDNGGDQDGAVSSAIAHVGISSLLGGMFSGTAYKGLELLDKATKATKANQYLADFGNRWIFNKENPNLEESVKNEVEHFYNSTNDIADEVYGAGNLKEQAINKLVPPINEAITDQNRNIANRISTKIQEMYGDPETYPTRLTKKIEGDAQKWIETVTNPNSDSAAVFDATQTLKQRLQTYAKFDKSISPVAAERGFVDASKELAFDLRNNLEDESVWGKAAALQKGINQAFVKFKAPLKDFESKFTTKVEGLPVVDPGKISSYMNKAEKASGEISKMKMQNFINAAEKYREEIGNLHHILGIEEAAEPASLNAVKSTLGKSTPGAKMADWLYQKGIPNLVDPTAAKLATAKAGAAMAGPVGGFIGWHAGEPVGEFVQGIVGRPISGAINKYVIPAALKSVTSIPDSGAGNIANSIEYAKAVGQGTNKISNAIGSIFKSGLKMTGDEISDKERDKLKDYINNDTFNRGIEREVQQPRKKGFAEGGEVNSTDLSAAPPTPAPTFDQTAPKTHFDTQNMLVSAAKERVNSYLTSIKPQTTHSGMIFDTQFKDKAKERSYDKAIDYAIKPLSIVNRIKDGTLNAEDMKHFISMYPEIHRHLSTKIIQEAVNNKFEDTKPNYKTRQALSLFLGQPLDSTFTPSYIQAAQSAFTSKQQPTPQSSNKKPSDKAMSGMAKGAKSYMTPLQASEAHKAEKQ